MQLQLITTLEDMLSLREEWNALLPQNAVNEIFLTWQWQRTWWETYAPGDLWIVAARDADQRLVGIAPYFVEQPSRVLRTIGCVEVTDYLDMLALPATRDEFHAALVDFLAAHQASYTRIDLCNIPADSPTLEHLPRLLTQRGFAVTVKFEDVCPFIPLPSSFEAYLEGLEKKHRHEVRRKLRRAEAASESGEVVSWYSVAGDHDLSAEMERFLTLMSNSHPDKARFLAENDGKHANFFRAVMPVLAACGWLQLSFLTVNGEAVAAYLNFDYNNRICVYNSGLTPTRYGHLSTGIVLLCYNIQRAIESGRTVFDFLQGNEEFKYRMGAQDREVKMLEADLVR